ncbi:unnamed protein product [Lymnaea stagnalis]|uniref:Voltage-gated hydrogen channel 1 n=1 Tax=Lymnaea stagnalis TaxID=6523 RepID=A0AAV2H1K6_LYMST
MIEVEKHRKLECLCLQHSVFVESIVITLTFVSGLAITGRNLITYDLITVPEHVSIAPEDESFPNNTRPEHQQFDLIRENLSVLDLLDKIFRYTSLVVAAVFTLEILLKLMTLQKKFLANPWHVFDLLVVTATLSVELTFYFVTLSDPALYSVTYVVMLRLWRVPITCTIHSNLVQQTMTEDLERYRLKAEERIKSLQDALTQKDETILYLQNKRESKLYDPANIDVTHKHPNTKGEDLNKLHNKASVKVSSLPKKSKQYLSSLEGETAFIDSNYKEEEPTKFSHNKTLSDVSDNNKINVENLVKTSSVKDMLTTESGDQFVNKLPRSEASYNLHEATKRPKQLPSRNRKRRSSTSEYIEYSSMGSPERDILYIIEKDKYGSWPCLDTDSEKQNVTKNVSDENNIEKVLSDGSCMEKKLSSASDTPSDVSNSSGNSESTRHVRMRKRRFTSCPEYVYTQRMSITNDESKLMGEDPAIDDYMFDNMTFVSDDEIGLQILAEFDGTKTYCNEDGIPMTSL